MSNEEPSSESTESESTEQQPDPIHNLKQEMNRKQSNLEAKLAETNAQLAQMIASVQASLTQAKPEPAKSAKSARDLLYDSPDEFVEQVTQQATAKAQAEVRRSQEMQSAVQSAIMEMSSKYPEFGQAGSEAAQKAVEYGSKLPAHLRGTAEGAEIAMARAAAELGLIPSSKRAKSSSNDDAAVGGGSRSTASSTKGKGKVDESVIIMGKLLGVDYEADKNRAKNLEKSSTRQKWNKYE
jgi:hypothetical protein